MSVFTAIKKAFQEPESAKRQRAEYDAQRRALLDVVWQVRDVLEPIVEVRDAYIFGSLAVAINRHLKRRGGSFKTDSDIDLMLYCGDLVESGVDFVRPKSQLNTTQAEALVEKLNKTTISGRKVDAAVARTWEAFQGATPTNERLWISHGSAMGGHWEPLGTHITVKGKSPK